MTKDEALNLALDAFKTLMIERGSIYDKAIIAIKEALAQPEPVIVGRWPSAAIGKETLQDAIERERAVGYREGHMAALSQRTWVGLSDAEIKKIVGSDRYTDLLLEVVNFVEAKLKEKNCG